jgi:hypothetical protein
MGFRSAPKGKIFQHHQEIRIRSPEIGRFLTNASGALQHSPHDSLANASQTFAGRTLSESRA